MHFILPKIQNMSNVKGVLLQWFVNFLIKKTCGRGIKNENMSDQQLAERLHNQLLEDLRNEKCT